MSVWTEVKERLRALVYRRREDQELAEELAFHLDMEAQKIEAAGANAQEARRRAQLRFGGEEQIKQDVRTQRGIAWLDHSARDVRHAWRTMLRGPGLAVVVILSLGVGIGVNTAIFSWIQTVVFRPLPGVRDANGFHFVEPRPVTETRGSGAHAPAPHLRSAGIVERSNYVGVSWPEYHDLRERLGVLQSALAFRMVPLNIGAAESAERRYAQLVSGNFFSALGLEPARGRFFLTDEGTVGGAPVVVISHGFWQNHLGGSPDAVGKMLRVNDRELTIVGIAPRGFQGTVLGLDFDLWVPATLAPTLLGSQELVDRSARGYAMMARLAPGVTAEQAQAELDVAMSELAYRYPASNAAVQADVLPFWEAPRGPQKFLARALVVLQGVLLLLLVAVVANTANLFLARASTRRREVSVRQTLGASRGRIIGLLLTENLLLALLGASVGVAIAAWGTNALRDVPFIETFPIRFQTSLDGVSLLFAVALGVLCGLTAGVAPAWQLARSDRQLALRSSTRVMGRSQMRGGLMATEVAVALVVLMAAGLFLQSFGETRDTDPGFQRKGVLLSAYDFREREFDGSSARTFAASLLERLRAQPGVQAAAIAVSVPLDIHGLPVRSFTLEGRARADAAADQALRNTVSPGYFQTMGIPLLAGHDFANLSDSRSEPQVIVNQEFVREYLAGAEPLGRRVEANGQSHQIVGVVKNSLYDSFGERPKPIIYYALRDRPTSFGQIHVRTAAGAELALTATVRRIVRELDPSLVVYDVRTLEQHVDKNLFLRRVPARMFVVLGPLLLVLAAIGIYAVVAFAVSRRTAEIGLRLAVGAAPREVVRQIVSETLRVVGYGALAGWLLAFLVYIHVAMGRPLDLRILAGVPALLLAVATVACWLPARRAARIEPTVALNTE
jgi:putative ABC transport system permease protein